MIISVNEVLRISGEFSTDTVTRLILPARGLTDCSQFSKFARVFFLNLESNSISDIQFLQYMPELRVVNLAGNRISSLAAFDFAYDDGRPFMEELQALYLENNNISNLEEIGILKRFTRLSILNLRGNPVANSYKALRELVLERTSVLTLNGIRVRTSVGLVVDYEKNEKENAEAAAEKNIEPKLQNWVDEQAMECEGIGIDEFIDPVLFKEAEEKIRSYWRDHNSK